MAIERSINAKQRPLWSLTGIRGVAAIWVVVYHLGQGVPGFSIVPSLYSSPLVLNGFRGVDLFFILSGFIMMHVHAKDFEHIEMENVRRFALLRLLRIYPVNFAALLIILAICLILPDYVGWFRSWASKIPLESYTPLSFLQTATLSNRWLLPDFGLWNIVTWSLSVELLAYLALPFLASLLLKVHSPGRCLFAAFISLTVMIALLLAFHNWTGGSVTRLGILRGFGGFIAGAAMCRYVSLTPGYDRAAGWAALASVAMIGVLLTLPRFTILMPFAFAALISSLSYQQGIVNALLSKVPIVFLGKISFSLYLVHYTPLAVLEWLFTSEVLPNTTATVLASITAYAVTVLLLSIFLHYTVERPCQRLGHTLVGRSTGNVQAHNNAR